MVIKLEFPNREAWLKGRSNYIGGSDAAAVIGLSPHLTNVELWRIKTGRMEQTDISNEPYVEYGTKAEGPLRELFTLDYPDLELVYRPNTIYMNKDYPWAHASLDGMLLDKDGRTGVWECKTTTITSGRQKAMWNGRLPDHYYCQVLHYMAVMEADFAILKAQLKHDTEDEPWFETRHYRIERSDVENDIKELMAAEELFWECVHEDRKPALILPA